MGDVAEYGTQLVSAFAEATHRHKQRKQAALPVARNKVAAVIEGATHGTGLQTFDDIANHIDALGREQIEKSLTGELISRVAEQCLRATVGRQDAALPIDHDDAISRH